MKKDNLITMSTRETLAGTELEAKITYDNPGNNEGSEIIGSVTRHVDAPLRVGDFHDADTDDFLSGTGPYREI